MRSFLATALAAAFLTTAFPATGSVPLDDDAGTGADAGDARTDATPIAPGRWNGTLTRHVDTADWYAFPVHEGEGVRVSASSDALTGGYVSVHLVDATGRWRPWATIANETGTWFVRATLQHADATLRATYAFDLHVEPLPPQDDAGSGGDAPGSHPALEVSADAWSGSFHAPYDHQDVYRIPVGAAEVLRMTVAGDNVTAWLHDSAPWTGGNASVVVWGAGRATYDVAITRVAVPDADAVAHHEAVTIIGGVGSVTGDGDAALASTENGLWRVNATAAKHVREDVPLSWRLALDGEGALLHADSEGIHRTDARGNTTTFLRAGGAFALGPDGRLYVSEGGRVASYAPDRSVRAETGVLRDFAADLAFAPDGSLYVLLFRDGAVHRVEADGSTTRVAVVGSARGALAFDAAGNGYVGSRDQVLRFDPATGFVERVATGGPVGSFAFAGDRLFAGGGFVGSYALGVEGFDGFRPVFRPEAPANLRVEISHAPADDGNRTVTVRVTNDGSSHTGLFETALLRSVGPEGPCILAATCPRQLDMRTISDLPPGTSQTYTVEAPAPMPLEGYVARVDVFDRVPESDESDNEARASAWP